MGPGWGFMPWRSLSCHNHMACQPHWPYIPILVMKHIIVSLAALACCGLAAVLAVVASAWQ